METILSSAVLAKYISQPKIDSYKTDLDTWLAIHDARKYLGPTDHFAIKVENETMLDTVVEAIRPYCLDKCGNTPGLSVRTMHGRRIAVALLKNPLYLGSDAVYCIEIMQPRPEAEGNDVVGLDHLELIQPNLREVEQFLKEKNADYYVDNTNPYKAIVVAFVNDRKERLKFTNKTLSEIIPMQIQDEPERVTVIFS